MKNMFKKRVVHIIGYNNWEDDRELCELEIEEMKLKCARWKDDKDGCILDYRRYL